jgi:DNA primase
MPFVFDSGIVNQVQQANDIVDVISEHVSLAKKGREMVGVCPFHDDHRPSMYVNSTKQIFKCFACGAGGSVFTFVQMRENLTFPQTIERLAERAGIKLPERVKSQAAAQQPDVDPNRLAKANAWAAKHFQKNLADEQRGKSARNYLDSRKLSQQSVNNWQIGLAGVNDELVKSAKAERADMGLLVKAGLATGSGSFSDRFVNRLMFTITDVTGRVIGFGGRTLDESGAKYINSPTTALFDKSNCLYGLEQARHQIVSTGTVVVVEGYTDCIMAHQFGCTNVVATLGTSFTTGHSRILRRYAKKIVLLFDSDTAGLEASNRALEICLSQPIDIKIAFVPEGKDPCDFLVAAGRERFQKLIDDAIDVFEFKWNRLTRSFSNNQTLVDNKAATEEFLQTIATGLQSGKLAAIEKGLIVNRLSKVVGLDSREISAELSRRIKRAGKNAVYKAENRKVTSINLGEGLSAMAQREILEVLLNKPAFFDAVKQKITVETFDVPILSQISAILFDTLNANTNASLASILARAESVEISKALVELADAGEEKGNFEFRLTAAVDVMQRHQAQKKKNAVTAEKDETQFLRSVYENTGRQNPHNIGMV